MGCGCVKKMCNNEDVLDISEENRENLKSQNLLFNNNEYFGKPDNGKENTEKDETLLESKIKEESVIDPNKNDYEESLYNKRVFELINKIRTNPIEYSKIILDNIKNISIENHKELNKYNGIEELKQVIVFKKKVKVKLFKGKESFLEAAKILENTSSMEPLKFNKSIIIAVPDSEEELKKSKFTKNEINEIMKKAKINAYFKEYVKNPEVAVLLMIVDDTEFSKGKKRKSLLNEEFKYIGIDSKFVGNNFIAHFSFSK